MMLNKIMMFLMAMIVALNTYAQQGECSTISDTFCLITLDIRNGNSYPILMNGLSKRDFFESLDKSNPDSLLASFYRNAIYTPSFNSGIPKMANYCLGSENANAFLNKNQKALALLNGNKGVKSPNKKFTLKSGEIVFLSTIKIGGNFWKVEKDSPGLTTSSNEIDISKIPQIKDCLVPQKVSIIKPTKKRRR